MPTVSATSVLPLPSNSRLALHTCSCSHASHTACIDPPSVFIVCHTPPSACQLCYNNSEYLKLKWDLEDLTASSSRLCMCDIDEYYQSFRAICSPLVHAHQLCYKDCNESFWLGLHPDNCQMVSQHLGPWCTNEQQRHFVDFREVFDTLVKIFSQHPCDIQWERKLSSCNEDENEDDYIYPTPTPAPTVVPASPIIAFMSPAPITPAVPTSSAIPVTSFTTAIFDSPAPPPPPS
ncbi:hypothetical protein F5148DRAFT_1291509 [Russula earlei]|uniref:Uncharacterized protein n=1 Tax=Russula earlei TaxID=71964 RepID=A0ACC0TUF7_9AGAM|nr:hypothetical protein F5148DRAFT_1291509 [Russula earlei]